MNVKSSQKTQILLFLQELTLQRVLKVLYWLLTFQITAKFKRRKMAQLLSHSGLFDTDYYCKQNPEVEQLEIDPLSHYLDLGASQGRDPNPLFDTSYYLEQYPEVAKSKLNPLAHYIMIGSQKGYNPHPLFKTSYYRESYQDVAELGINPLLHYLKIGVIENRDPFPCTKIQLPKIKQVHKSREIKSIPHSLDENYQSWLNINYPAQEDLKKITQDIPRLNYQPIISIIIPLLSSSHEYLSETLESVINQIYLNWEILIIVSSELEEDMEYILSRNTQHKSYIKIVSYCSNESRAISFNTALENATGELIAFLNPNDLLTPHALYEVVKCLNNFPNADLIYSDEDTINEQNYLEQPYFKPDWCPDSFLSRMYTGHLSIYKRSLIQKIGGFRIGYEGSEEYDLVLRLTEKTKKIVHIPDVLYHKRIYSESSYESVNNKKTAKKAIKEALKRRNEEGIVINAPRSPRDYLVRYKIAAYELVSIIIPTKNLGEVLNQCLISIFEKTTYPNFEVIIVDNGSTEDTAIKVLNDWLEKEKSRLKILKLDIPFNYSTLNNFGVNHAQGKYLLFLNNDTQIITPDWLEGMVEQAQRASIGAVGALLLFPDNTIQHAGVIAGIFEFCGHSHKRFNLGDSGYFNQLNTVNNYLAVTGACLMCRRDVFEEVGGFDEIFAVNFNDIDLCFKMINKGYRNIYLPHVMLYHYEAKSRGYDLLSNSKKARFLCEMKYFQTRWSALIQNDPCYSQHLTLEKEDYHIKIS